MNFIHDHSQPFDLVQIILKENKEVSRTLRLSIVHQIQFTITIVIISAKEVYYIFFNWCFHGLTLLHRNNWLNLSGHEYFKESDSEPTK